MIVTDAKMMVARDRVLPGTSRQSGTLAVRHGQIQRGCMLPQSRQLGAGRSITMVKCHPQPPAFHLLPAPRNRPICHEG